MEGGLLLLGDPCHEPIPVQQVSDQGQERISLAAGAIIGAECFWKGSDAKARIFGLHHSHMRQDKCNRKLCPGKPYFGIPRAKCNLFAKPAPVRAL